MNIKKHNYAVAILNIGIGDGPTEVIFTRDDGLKCRLDDQHVVQGWIIVADIMTSPGFKPQDYGWESKQDGINKGVDALVRDGAISFGEEVANGERDH